MQIGRWRFRPGLWPSVAFVLLLPLLLALGFWQVDRAGEKAGLEREYHRQRARPALDLSGVTAASMGRGLLWREATASGRYLSGQQFLLDNRVRDGMVGYLVYTPLRLQDRAMVALVNRGWVAAGLRRDEPPAVPVPAGPVSVRGVIKPPVDSGLVLEGVVMEEMEGGLVRIQHMDLDALAERIGGPLFPYILRLEEPDDSGLFRRDWTAPGYGRMRHIGYAVQWFALAATLLVLYVVLNTHRRGDNEPDSH